MTYPRVNIKSGIEVDTANYSMTFNEAKELFFQSKNYLVLPYIPKQKTIAGKTIYLPRIPKGKTIEEGLNFPPIDEQKYRGYIKENFKPFWKDLVGILGGGNLSGVQVVNVEITNVGSGGRELNYPKNSNEIGVRIRKDMLLEQIFSLILMEILPRIGFRERYTWEEETAIREWLKNVTVLNKYFPTKFIPMLSNLRENKQQAKYQLEAQEYLRELGLSTNIDINKEKLIINGHKFALSPKEHSLLRSLYDRKGEVVDYETIYKDVWGSNFDNFSLYAISKLVERVRKKLIKGNVSSDLIQSYKGKGYYIGINV